MKELLKDIDIHNLKDRIVILFYYFNNNQVMSFIVFALSTQYVYFTEKDKKIKDLFFWYTILILLIIWNPFCIYVLGKFINFGALYRLYYMLPLCPVIAYVFTKIVENQTKKIRKVLLMIGIALAMCITGNHVFEVFPVYKVNNLYQLPNESVFVAEAIYKDSKYENKKAIVPYGMSSQIQQIHPSISLLYTRIVKNPSEDGNSSPADTDDPTGYEPVEKLNSGDTRYISELCKQKNINYVVFYQATVLQEPLENFGFEKIASDYGVDVYRSILEN